jgi:hypothetical protein
MRPGSNKSIKDIYHWHHKALDLAGLSPKYIPMLQELITNNDGKETHKVKMTYHRFSNLREVLQGDLSKKLTDDIESMDFKMRDCNCRRDRLGKCHYRGIYRVPIVVYKITCKMMNKIYIGNTQHHFKNRMRGHFQDVKKLLEKGVHQTPTQDTLSAFVPARGAPSPNQVCSTIHMCSV